MRAFCLGLWFVVFAVAASAQEKPAGQDKKTTRDDKPPKTLTLTGCVTRGAGPSQFAIADDENGRFQIKGGSIDRYVGQRVELVATPDNGRLKIKGGLYPTPNVAGQAGAIDPAQAAIAAQPGGPSTGTGDISLPTVNVKSVKALGGECR
jgi:hypothetical protein